MIQVTKFYARSFDLDPRHVVYGLFDPSTGELRYIGKSTTGPKRRLQEHLSPSKLCTHTHKNCWLRSLLEKGLRPDLVVLEVCGNAETAEILEKQAIAHYRGLGFRLTNNTDGGEGATGYHHTEEHKRYMRSLFLGRERPGVGEKVRLKALGRVPSRAARVRSSTTHGGRSFVDADTGRMYDTLGEAARELGLSAGNISSVLRGRYKHTGGHRFSYVGASS